MNFQFYLEKLYASDDFANFKKENEDAYLCSCFFVIDKEKEDNKQHFDYFLKKDKKMFSFKVESGCDRVPVENLDGKIPVKIRDNYDFSFGEIEKLILERMEKEGVKNKIQKILLSLQNAEGKDVLLGTVFISGLGMIKVRIDVLEMEINGFEKKSFMDMFRVSHKSARDKNSQK